MTIALVVISALHRCRGSELPILVEFAYTFKYLRQYLENETENENYKIGIIVFHGIYSLKPKSSCRIQIPSYRNCFLVAVVVLLCYVNNFYRGTIGST